MASAVDSTTEAEVGSVEGSVADPDLMTGEESDSNPTDTILALPTALRPGLAARLEAAGEREEMAEAGTTIATAVEEVAVRTTTEAAVERVEAVATVNLSVHGAAVMVGMAAERSAETRGEAVVETTPTGNDPTTATSMRTGTNEGTEELSCTSTSIGKPGSFASASFLSSRLLSRVCRLHSPKVRRARRYHDLAG